VANNFLTPDVIARTTLGLLTREIVLPGVVWRDFDTEFNGRVGESVTVRVPAVATAREWALDNNRAAPITTDELTEDSFTVALTKVPYHSASITDEDMDLRIENFGAQVLLPQVRAIAEKIESYVATAMQGATYETELAVNGSDPYLTLVEARKALNDANVPRAERFVVVGSAIEAAILSSDRFKPLDNATGQSAFSEATIGRIAGFTVVGSNALEEDEAYCLHRTAYILATRAPAVPAGAKQGSAQSYQGLACTWTQDYDPDYLRDRSVVRAFAGAQATVNSADEVDRAVKLTLTVSS
jgi:hypothetical protein